MPDFAPNLTHRYVAKYVAAGLQHEVMVRIATTVDQTTAVAEARANLTAIQTALHTKLFDDFAWVSAKFSLGGDNFFTPAPPPAAGVVGSISPATFSKMNYACELNFIGRGGLTPISMAFFGVFFPLDDAESPASNGRVFEGESGPVANVLVILRAFADLVNAANVGVRWQGYANYKVNDHWLRIARKGPN